MLDTTRNGNPADVFKRIGLWLCSLSVSVISFALVFSVPVPLQPLLIPFQFTTLLRVFFFNLQLMTIYALAVSVFFLPFLVALKDAEQRRLWMILASGTLIGPACLMLLGLIVQLRGGDPHMIWNGDGISLGIVPSIPFALGLGFLTASLYVIGLKVINRRSKGSQVF